jgi:gephyrin
MSRCVLLITFVPGMRESHDGCQVKDTMRLDPRTEFHRVIIRSGQQGLEAFSTGGQRSSRVASLSGANGLVVLPQRKDSRSALQTGDTVEAIIISELHML